MKLTLSKSFDSLNWLTPRISVMDRYLMMQLLPPFLFGVGAFSSLGVAIGTMFDLMRRVAESGLPMMIAVKILALNLPFFIGLSFPMSMLLSTLLTYSQLSSNSELIALRSTGVSIYRLVVPALLMSLIVTGMNFVLNELVVPAANYEATVTLKRAITEETPDLPEKNIIYQQFTKVDVGNGEKEDILTYWLYAKEYDGEKLKALTIVDLSQPDFTQILVAESATWNMDKNTGTFFNGTSYLVAPDGSYRYIGQFSQQELYFPRAAISLSRKKREPNEMNIVEAEEYLKLLKPTGDERKIRKFIIRIQQKYSLPFACVAFALVGATMGTKPQRTSKATGFGVCVLLVFGYYLLMSVGDALGLSGVMSPYLAGWLPTLCGFAMGFVLLVNSSR